MTIEVPDSVPVEDFETINNCFSGHQEVLVKHGTPAGSLHGYIGLPIPLPEVNEAVNWVVNIGPDGFRILTIWALETYFAKKVIDGFATEFGKGLWKGVTELGSLIVTKYERNKEKGVKEPTHYIAGKKEISPMNSRSYHAT